MIMKSEADMQAMVSDVVFKAIDDGCATTCEVVTAMLGAPENMVKVALSVTLGTLYRMTTSKIGSNERALVDAQCDEIAKAWIDSITAGEENIPNNVIPFPGHHKPEA